MKSFNKNIGSKPIYSNSIKLDLDSASDILKQIDTTSINSHIAKRFSSSNINLSSFETEKLKITSEVINDIKKISPDADLSHPKVLKNIQNQLQNKLDDIIINKLRNEKIAKGLSKKSEFTKNINFDATKKIDMDKLENAVSIVKLKYVNEPDKFNIDNKNILKEIQDEFSKKTVNRYFFNRIKKIKPKLFKKKN